jgi:hypothetical protein
VWVERGQPAAGRLHGLLLLLKLLLMALALLLQLQLLVVHLLLELELLLELLLLLLQLLLVNLLLRAHLCLHLLQRHRRRGWRAEAVRQVWAPRR